jgi:acetyl esterase/lipase
MRRDTSSRAGRGDLRTARDFLARGRTHRYGRHRSQRAELYVPSGDTRLHPVMVAIHGGSWQARYGKIVMRGLVSDLVRRGWAVWNVEYRRVGAGGGWPATFEDVARAIDHLATLGDPQLDLDRVSVLGHSAGGHLALWAASRERLPPGAPGRLDGHPRVRLRATISQAGVCDLSTSARRVPGGAAATLMGGGPDALPERYAAADPMRLLAPSAPVLLVHGTADQTVSVDYSRSYEQAARASGAQVELVEIAGSEGQHRRHIDPRGEAWSAVTRWLRASPDA